MPRSRWILCLGYFAVAVLALFGTFTQNVRYMHPEEGRVLGFAYATARFWPETLATPASTSITVDLGLLLIPIFALMILEARRLGIRFVWLYIVGGILIAISVTFPLFLIAREWRLAKAGESSGDLGFRRGDWIGFGVLSAAAVIFTSWTMYR